MKKFKIKVADHLCKNKQWKKAGDIVDESQLCSPSAELVSKGYIEDIEEEDEDIEEEYSDLSKMTKKELIEFANVSDFEINESDKKDLIIQSIISQASED